MPPSVALALWFVLLVALLRLDPARPRKGTLALWIPVIWLSINASRLPSQWLTARATAAEAFEQGSPIDRLSLSALILLATAVVVSRSFLWRRFIAHNAALLALLVFALISFAWSDYPMIALKRWFRDIGNYMVLMVVLTDRAPVEAVRTVLRRVCFLLIPLSIVLYKYYAHIGRQFDVWTGQPMTVGVTTSKNMLGALCLVGVLYFTWDTMMRWGTHDKASRRTILVNVAFLGMALWLLMLANSATSAACLAFGWLILWATHGQSHTKRAVRVARLMPAALSVYAVLALGFGVGLSDEVAQALGRDATLTGRTEIWNNLLEMQTNPILGAGYESFWLGSRLAEVWRSSGTINQAHNGYLQVYLNLGLVGLALVILVLLSSYRDIYNRLRHHPGTASFGLTILTVLVVYNTTESAFLGGLLWMVALMAAGTLLLDPAPCPDELTADVRAMSSPTNPAWGQRFAADKQQRAGSGDSRIRRDDSWRNAQVPGRVRTD